MMVKQTNEASEIGAGVDTGTGGEKVASDLPGP